MKSIYLINPRPQTPTYYGAEVLEHRGFRPAQAIADLATTSVAAFVPADWKIDICDDFIDPVDLDHPAELIALTGKITQGMRMLELAAEFRKRGKTVIIGGPYASLSPEVFRDHCDILVIGEIESMAHKLFADLDQDQYQTEYKGERTDLSNSPLPRWDLYPNDSALSGCVQTSRGCPFQCEFCDVIQYLGREQRHKPTDIVLAELDQLYQLGYRAVFLADDNFTVYRKRAKALLEALRDWNTNQADGPIAFATQVSIDAARDPELMNLVAEAGITSVFIGIETPNEESLKESLKRQNVGVNLVDEIQVFLDHGIVVDAGMIVGFDHDGLDIFDRQYRFAMSAPVPRFTLGALVAPAATPLHERMEEGGRLMKGGSEVAGTPWDTNIVPLGMTNEQLVEGLRWLCSSLYSLEAFTQRTLQMVEALGPQRGPFSAERGYAPTRTHRQANRDSMTLIRRLVRQGPGERKMWNRLREAIAEKPEAGRPVMAALFQYAQIRCLYEIGSFWEPHPTEAPPFPASEPASQIVTVGAPAPTPA